MPFRDTTIQREEGLIKKNIFPILGISALIAVAAYVQPWKNWIQQEKALIEPNAKVEQALTGNDKKTHQAKKELKKAEHYMDKLQKLVDKETKARERLGKTSEYESDYMKDLLHKSKGDIPKLIHGLRVYAEKYAEPEVAQELKKTSESILIFQEKIAKDQQYIASILPDIKTMEMYILDFLKRREVEGTVHLSPIQHHELDRFFSALEEDLVKAHNAIQDAKKNAQGFAAHVIRAAKTYEDLAKRHGFVKSAEIVTENINAIYTTYEEGYASYAKKAKAFKEAIDAAPYVQLEKHVESFDDIHFPQ